MSSRISAVIVSFLFLQLLTASTMHLMSFAAAAAAAAVGVGWIHFDARELRSEEHTPTLVDIQPSPRHVKTDLSTPLALSVDNNIPRAYRGHVMISFVARSKVRKPRPKVCFWPSF